MTLTGTGFGTTIADNRVMIGEEDCNIKSATDTQIVCKAPEKSSETTTEAILYVRGVTSPNLCQCASGMQVRMCLYIRILVAVLVTAQLNGRSNFQL